MVRVLKKKILKPSISRLWCRYFIALAPCYVPMLCKFFISPQAIYGWCWFSATLILCGVGPLWRRSLLRGSFVAWSFVAWVLHGAKNHLLRFSLRGCNL